MKSYKNLYFIGAIIIFLLLFFLYRNVSIDNLMLGLGYYDEKITVANTADVHGHIIYEDNSWGQYTSEDIYGVMGLPIAKGLYDKIKSENSIILDSGDMFHGTNEALINDGEGIVKVANGMGYAGAALGSNDFNFGYERLLEIKEELNYPILCANFYVDGKRVFEPYDMLTVGGKKVAVFELITDHVAKTSKIKDLKNLEVKDPVEEAKGVLKEIRNKADVVIMVSYLGDNIDEELVKKVEGIDLVLSGRRHNLYTKAVKVNNTYIAEAGAWGTHLGIADIYFKDSKVKKITWRVESTTKESYADEKMNSIAEEYHKKALVYQKKVVGESKVDLDGKRINIRTGETNFGDLMADAMRYQGNADIALMNGGGIRESIVAGKINMYQIQKALPFSNSIITIRATGDQIVKALERGVKKYPDAKNGAFLQVSGIKYTIDGSKEVGKRIKDVYVGNEPIDRKKSYTVALSDYIYYGGDDYVEFEDCEILDSGELLSNVLAHYIKEKKTITTIQMNRVTFVNKRY